MKIKNRLEQDSISGGKNIKKKIGALKRKTVPFLVVILVVTSALCIGQQPGTVHNIDTDEWYDWIQEAIDDPQTNDNPDDHDTIEVYDPNPSYHPSGMYVENIVVNKSLTLRASDGAHPVIDGGGSDHVVTILGASDVEVSGFTIQNGGGRGVFISAWAPNATIKNNNIIDNGDSGIFISFGSDYCLVEYNKITSNLHGITTGCSENIGCMIRNNTIGDNTVDGMHLLAISEFTITENHITNNTWGIHFYDGTGGSCYNNLVIKNNITSNASNGIGLFGSSNNNRIQSNDISQNGYGVDIRGNSNKNEIKGNYIIDNEYGIRIMYPTVIDNVIYNNHFNNTHNAHDEGTNKWNIDKTDEDNGEDFNIIDGDWFGGNYWSDYTGEDNGLGDYPHDEIDGLGDTEVPYTCNGEIQNGGDDLPLVFPSGPCIDIEKKVLDPTTGELVDNIEVPVGTEVDFVITVCNCGTSDLESIKVVDYFFDCLEYLDSEASVTIDDISISGNQVVWEFGSLTLHPGDCFDIKVKATVISEGNCENCVKVHAESQGESISDKDCVAVTGVRSGICLGSALLAGILALGVVVLNRKKE